MFGNRAAAAIRPSDDRGDLPAGARALLDRLPHVRQSFASRQRLVREGERQLNCFVLLSGFAHRHRVTPDGQRQITGVFVPGDIAGFEGVHGGPSRNSIETAGPVTVAAISLKQLDAAAHKDATVAAALWGESLADAAATGEWVVNIGRRSARERILNLFCELALRFERAGVSSRRAFDLPLTQADIADATGLTPVHVNRVIRSLEGERLIERRGRNIDLKDWGFIASLAGFETRWWQRPAAARAL